MYEFFAKIHYYSIENQHNSLFFAINCRNVNFPRGQYYINMLLLRRKLRKFATNSRKLTFQATDTFKGAIYFILFTETYYYFAENR